MKHTILSDRQGKLLENLIVKYGNIVTSDHIFMEAREFWDYKQTKNIITALIKNGWMMRIKRGLYSINDLASRGFLSLSPYVIANALVKDSYVSFESALHHHGMFDQWTGKIVSLSLNAFKKRIIQDTEYQFIKTKSDYFFGWQETEIENRKVRIATPEKALIDSVNFHKNKYAIDLAIEKIRDHKSELNFLKLNEYLLKFPAVTIKIFGFIYDLFGIESHVLFNFIKKKHATHRMIAKDQKFNAKWRIYYDPHFDRYKSPDS